MSRIDPAKLPARYQEQIRAQTAHKPKPAPQAAIRPETRADAGKRDGDAVAVEFHLSGQVRGGKNNMVVTRSGGHFPRKLFKNWRDDACIQIAAQLPGDFDFASAYFTEPVSAIIIHRASDRGRHDIPAILDALFHVLERAGIVADDSLIKQLSYGEIYSKENPGADIVLRTLEAKT